MRPDATGGQLTLLATGNFDTHLIIQVANGSGTLVALTSRIVNVPSHKVPGPDNPIASLSVEFVRQILTDGTDSLAPLVADSLLNRDDAVAYSPLLEMGREVVFKTACVDVGDPRPADGSFIEQFRGRISHVSGPEEHGTITIQCYDMAGVLAKTWTENAAGTSVQTVPLARITIGLVDYFLPGTKEFDANDWTSAGGSPFVNGSGFLGIDKVADTVFRGFLLNTAPDQNGGYVSYRFSNVSTGAATAGVGIVADVTAGSLDMQGGRFRVRDTAHAGPVEIIAGAQTTHGSDTSNLGNSQSHSLHAWVEPDAASPAAKTQYKSGTNSAVVQASNGPLSAASVSGKPGGFIQGAAAGGTFSNLYEWFYATLDRYVWVYGLTPGQKANIRTSGNAKRFTDAVADGTGLAKVDVFGDETPLASYKLSIFESDGTTLVEELHPTDADGVVWGGDIWTTEVTTTVPPIVSIGGTPVEEVLQAVIDRERPDEYPLEVPSAPSPPFVITRDLTTLDDFVWNVLTNYAGKIGWLIWMRYDALSDAYLTFFEPARSKTTPDFTISRVYSISALDKNDENIRNVVHGFGTTITGAQIAENGVKVTDATSILKYGGAVAPGIRRYMRLVEEEGSVIVTLAQLTALVTAALSDSKDPDTILQAEVLYFWPGEVAVDLYEFTAKEQFFDDNTDWAPFSIAHSFTGGAYRCTARSNMTLRAKPSAGSNIWRRQGGDESTPATPLDPKFRWLPKAVDTTVGPAKGCLWVKAIEQGKKVRAVRFRTRETAKEWGEWETPLRSAGAGSKVFGGTLGIGEWEHEVVLNAAELSFIGAEWQDDNGQWFTITASEAIDENTIPAFLDGYPLVQALNIISEADDDTLSTRFVKTAGGGGAWDDAFDDNEGIMAVPVPDGDEWTVDVTISNKIEADWGDIGEITVTRTVTVSNASQPAEGGTPTNLTIGLTEPADGDDEIEIEIEANQAPTDYRFKAYASYQFTHFTDPSLSQTFAEVEITHQLSPNPLTMPLPTSPETFTFVTSFEREDASPDGRVEFQFRFTIVDLNADPDDPPIFDTGAYPFAVAYDCLAP